MRSTEILRGGFEFSDRRGVHRPRLLSCGVGQFAQERDHRQFINRPDLFREFDVLILAADAGGLVAGDRVRNPFLHIAIEQLAFEVMPEAVIRGEVPIFDLQILAYPFLDLASDIG